MAVRGFDFNIHCDGVFVGDPLRYSNGEMLEASIPIMGFTEFFKRLENETGNPLSAIYNTTPGTQPEDGLLKILDDWDVNSMFDLAFCYGKLNIYLDHFDDHLEPELEKYVSRLTKVKESFSIGEQSVKEAMEEGGSNSNDKGKDDIGKDDKGKEPIYTSSEDEDYFPVNDSDSESDAASVDYLSEDEVEVKELRTRKAESKKLPKTAAQPKLFARKTVGNGDPFDTLAEHEGFLEDLLKKLGEGDNEDPFKLATEVEKYPIHDPSTHWRLQKPRLGERFESTEKFKECMTYYSLANGFSIWYSKSSQSEVIAQCGQRPPRLKDPSKGKRRKANRYPNVVRSEGPKCPFRCFGRIMRKEASFQVISLVDHHTCVKNFKFGSLINYKFIGRQFGGKIRANPNIRLVDIADLVMKKYKCIVSGNQCRMAKTYALNEFEKSIEEHYGMLRSYAHELLSSNPGSTVKLGVTINPDEKVYFDRFYVCLKALKDGWINGCRRVIALDGCFLKSPNQGELLTAIGRDGNNHIYPIAWVVVNIENKDNWGWFIDLVAGDLEIEGGNGVTLISDQHKGLIQAVKDVMPYAEHRQCARHIYENFRKTYSGVEFKTMFWSASKASYPVLFQKHMDKVKSANPNAYKWLNERDPKSWSRAFFEVNRGCEAVENGFSECFNAVIVVLRNKPIITMLEAIRVIVMERMNSMRKFHEKWEGPLCPTIQKKLDWCKDQHRFWHPIFAGGNDWEVRQCNEGYKVNVADRTCSCRMWQISGVPCPHACSVILHMNMQPEDYVSNWFSRNFYLNAYISYIRPVGGMNEWVPNDLVKPLPPIPIPMPGRKKQKRRRAAHEGGSDTRISKEGVVITCQNCHETGHNKKTCKSEPKPKPQKIPKKKGRPRKNARVSSDNESGNEGGNEGGVTGNEGAASGNVGGASNWGR